MGMIYRNAWILRSVNNDRRPAPRAILARIRALSLERVGDLACDAKFLHLWPRLDRVRDIRLHAQAIGTARGILAQCTGLYGVGQYVRLIAAALRCA
jgi:hypothetical protein